MTEQKHIHKWQYLHDNCPGATIREICPLCNQLRDKTPMRDGGTRYVYHTTGKIRIVPPKQ